MRKCGKGTLLLMSAVMAASLFTGCGKDKSSQAQKNEVYATIKKSDQSASAAQICAWISYRAKNNRLFQNEGMELSYCSDNLAVFSDSVGSVIYDRTKKKVIAAVDLDKIGCDYFYSEGDEEESRTRDGYKGVKRSEMDDHLQSITRKSKRKYLCIFAQTV